ncbi:MAG: isocitrate lyase [Candidatus Taylorbacteria bacterium]|nr:isocitrate lyase [Candidatus Taylorbacteria bacterium]
MTENSKEQEILNIKESWNSPRWKGIKRDYTAEDVYRLRGSFQVDHTIARKMSEKLWKLLHGPYLRTGGVLTGHMAVQAVRAGWRALYCSGWQVAGDANTNLETYPDQSIYSADSVPTLVERLNNALIRPDEIQHMQGKSDIDWLVPIVADAEAGFGGILNVFELMKSMIKAGAAGVHFEDQLASEKKCGHMGGKVVIPTREFVKKLKAARKAADRMGVPTVLIARTDALSAKLIANDIDERDRKFISNIRECCAVCGLAPGSRDDAGYFRFTGGIEAAIQRSLIYAPYADVLWCETSKPDIGEAREFAQAIHAEFPGKFLAYNCSPSFNWRKHLSNDQIDSFQDKLGEMGYKFQFVTLFSFHVLNYYMYMIALDYARRGMSAFADLQEAEFEAQRTLGYTAVEHQKEVGTEYFDEVQKAITGEDTETIAMRGSTEEEQFKK